ncbi:MAG: RsmD family RNA methyltransferase [Prevotella sp.]|nr:RsmD family RNA methyltransferase [Prevotella sp.]
MNEATWKYVKAHRMEDVRRLALSGSKAEGVDMLFALQQIAGWQTARKKLPSWAAVDGIVYPPHLNMEQCSSEQTARYKGKVVARDFDISIYRDNDISTKNESFVDLTGGLGVDFSFMSRPFSKRTYVERNPKLCEIARHNFQLLGLEAEVICDDAVSFLAKMPHSNVVFLDPARRNEHGSRTYGIEDCTPNVLELLPLLKEKADTIILKLSPMLDWRKAVSDLGGVSEVHIVSVDNECKELLLVICQDLSTTPLLACVNGDSSFQIVPNVGTDSFRLGNSQFLPRKLTVPAKETIRELTLLEPNASIMKAGCFKEIAQMYGIQQLSANSHLFVSDHDIEDFPGRRFTIERMTSMNKQELKTAMAGIDRANVAVRNFPLTAEQLRKKLKIKDGGDVFIFGATLQEGSHQLFICRKIG